MYSVTLRNELRPVIRTTGRGILSEGVLVLHENASPYTAARSGGNLRELKFEVLDQPVWNPDCAPSDFNLFGNMTWAVGGRRFADDEEVKEKVHDWLGTQPNSFCHQNSFGALDKMCSDARRPCRKVICS
jgi:hypothetical protein